MAALGKVLIVGGGIAGMTLAVALQRAGFRPEIVEVNPDWSVVGVGISLGSPALRAFRMLDLLDRCIAQGFGYSSFDACDADGNVTGSVEMPRLNGPEYPAAIGIMRHALHDALREAVTEAGVPVRLGVTVGSFQQDGDGVDVAFTDATGDRYDLVVGTDGAYSKIREMLFGETHRPQYTGQAVWRATVHRPPHVRVRTSYFGPRSKSGFNPVSDRQMYVYFVQNLPEFVRIPDEQLPATIRELIADFGGIIAAVRDEIVDPQQVVYRPVVSHLQPAPWYRGRVLVIGDAAHTATPHMASGAGIAVEDSVVLTELLQTPQPIDELLAEFMRRRFERCRLVVENSFLLGEWEKAPDLPGADPVGVLDRSLKALAAPF